jgi:hypothetical protein
MPVITSGEGLVWFGLVQFDSRSCFCGLEQKPNDLLEIATQPPIP